MTKREFLDTVFALAPNEANAIMDAFDEYVDSNESHWIPATERLPERGKDVLVTRDYDGRMDCIKSCRYVEVACCYGEDDNAVWSAFSDEYKMIPSMHKVVAWMPLPEPYKGVTE